MYTEETTEKDSIIYKRKGGHKDKINDTIFFIKEDESHIRTPEYDFVEDLELYKTSDILCDCGNTTFLLKYSELYEIVAVCSNCGKKDVVYDG